MRIVAVKTTEPHILKGLNDLLAQLTAAAPGISASEFEQIVASEGTTILVALEADRVIGTLSLVLFRIPTGIRARIEDVVVDKAFRGRGTGESLTRRAIALAKDLGAHVIDLTSNPTRIAANRLYRKIGFEMRTTNIYRYKII